MNREEIIQNIKDCAHCMIDNAENMIGIGDIRGDEEIIITCHVSKKDEVRHITISRTIVPGYYA